MIFFYGTRAVHLQSAQLKTMICPSCQTQGSLVISVFRRHFHLFWLPMFPLWKTGASQCSHCKNVLEPKEMPDTLKNQYDLLKTKSKGPIWQFSGLILVVLMFVHSYYAKGKEKEREQYYIEYPKVGDVYEVKIDESYTTLKVVGVSQDSVEVIPNKLGINKMSKISEIDKIENYSEENIYQISKKELKEKYTSGEIYDVNR